MLRLSGLSIRLSSAALLACLFAGSFPSVAQTPTPEQLQAFKNLSPEQQQAILSSMGNGSASSGKTRADKQLSFPELMRQRPAKEDEEEQDDYYVDSNGNRVKREPRLKGDDTIILRLDIRETEQTVQQEEEAKQKQQQGQAPGQLTGPLPPQLTGTGAQRSPNDQQANDKKIERTPLEQKQLDDFRERVQRRNPYKLDHDGVLNIPELGPIPLAGLTVEQAQDRLNADYILRDFRTYVTRLPLTRRGTAALKQFGYDIFGNVPSTFAPATDVPVPAEYVMGPGDTIEVQLIGNTKGTYSLVVNREGQINFPELGPVTVSGMRFEEIRRRIEERVNQQMIGTRASVTMGELRSIRVFVLGDAEQPGSYTVSGLSTVTNALLLSGGVKKIGSLRKVELKRNGSTVRTLDLYDLLLHGDTRADVRLQPGDVIFIPPIGPTVGVSGQVRRPAIYELKGEASADDLVELAGGLKPEADSTMISVDRVNEKLQRTTVSVNLKSSGKLAVRSGDVINVPAIRPSLEESVTVSGYVFRPGEFQYREGLRLSDVIHSVDEVRPNGDLHYVLIRRESQTDKHVSVVSADLARAVAAPGTDADLRLAPRDRIYVFDSNSGRDQVVEPLLRDLRTQSNLGEPTRQIRVGGMVKVPGQYPLEPGMHVSDLIRAGGGLDESAYSGSAELSRYEVTNGQSRETELVQIDLAKVLAGDKSADIEVRPFDNLLIKETPLWNQQEDVEIVGEVRFPGRYPVHRGETLRSVIERAGGLTNYAFVEGAVFTRVELREREKQQLETLANRMQSDVGQLSLQATQETGKDAGAALAIGQSLLANLRNSKAVGRLVIDLKKVEAAAPGSEDEIFVKDGDMLKVPRVTQEVTVLGEVQGTTSHLYRASLGRDDYIALSGGVNKRADEKHIYVVRADGSIVTDSGRWFGSSTNMHPGDTVVVPLDAERMRPLPLWIAVTTIIYNLAIAAAAVNSF
jgi:polysaccharide biosynthesis/export protein